jgi:hypothetical protein
MLNSRFTEDFSGPIDKKKNEDGRYIHDRVEELLMSSRKQLDEFRKSLKRKYKV